MNKIIRVTRDWGLWTFCLSGNVKETEFHNYTHERAAHSHVNKLSGAISQSTSHQKAIWHTLYLHLIMPIAMHLWPWAHETHPNNTFPFITKSIT